MSKKAKYNNTQLKKIKRGLCATLYCRNQKPTAGNICPKCTKRRFKESNPKKYCYDYLKNNAKRRGKDFSLSFEQFCVFVDETGYMEHKGISKLSMQIDRKDNNEGYHYWNIRAITMIDNVNKQHNKDYNDCPF